MLLAAIEKLASEALERVRSERSEASEHGYRPDEWKTAKSERVEADLEHLLLLVNLERGQRSKEDNAPAEEEVPKKTPKGRYMGIAGDYPKYEDDVR